MKSKITVDESWKVSRPYVGIESRHEKWGMIEFGTPTGIVIASTDAQRTRLDTIHNGRCYCRIIVPTPSRLALSRMAYTFAREVAKR
jgi:hypothetical protein